jgi:hypothetical protein
MANLKISQLSAASALAGTESVPIVQSAANVAATPTQISSYVEGVLAAKSTKSTPVDADSLLLVDSEASSALKRLTINDLSNALAASSDFAGGGASTIGRHSIPIMAGSMLPALTNGPGVLTQYNGGSQVDYAVLGFDASTIEYAHFWVPMPKKWNEGTVTARVLWMHDATVTNFGVVWALQAVAVGDDDTLNVAQGTAQSVTDTGGTTKDLYASPETSAITVGGTPQAEDMVCFRVYRDATNGSDTLAIDAGLIAVVLYVTTAAETDA